MKNLGNETAAWCLALGVLALCWAAPAVSGEQIFTFVDARGVTHFTNVPSDDRFVPIPRPQHKAARKAMRAPQYGGYDGLIRLTALEHDVPPALVKAVIAAESRFDSDAVGRVNFVRRAQQVGFSLEEIRSVLDDTAGTWNDVVVDKLAALRSRRAELDSMIGMLEEVRVCGCRVVAECPRTANPI